MTYLEIVNGVLRRLREDEVNTVNSTAYSKMIGDFVNDAKSVVEKAWDWTHLREVVTVSAVQGTSEYTWTGKGNPVEIISSWNDTQNSVLRQNSQSAFDRRKFTQNTLEGAPAEFCIRRITGGDTIIEVWPTPDAAYNLKFNAKVEQGLLTADATELLVPYLPVLHMALFFAARERGETGGTSTAEYSALADQYLSDAIALDAANHPEETVFTAGYYWPTNTMRL